VTARALAGVAAVIAAASATAAGVLNPVEHKTVDARFKVRGAQERPSEIVVVGIDERSISELGTWPLRRRLHARAVDRLSAAGARAIVYDVQFTEPSDRPEDDLALYDAIGRAGGAILASGTSDAQGRTDVLGGDESLAAISSRAAAANFPADSDGVVRRYPEQIGRLSGIAAVTAERIRGRELRFGVAPIDFRGGFTTVAFADLVAGRVPERALRGKIVVIGATAPTLQDRHRVATGVISGAELQANAIWTALHGNPLREAPRWWAFPAILLLGLAVPLVSLRRALVVAVALGVVTLVAAQIAFAYGLVVPLAGPLVALALGTLGTLLAGYGLEARSRRRAAELEREVAERTRELRETQLEIIQRLGRAAEHRDDETGSHLKRMSRLCGQLARATGMSRSEADELEQASLMHDVGKIGIPDDILHKPGRLTPEERAVMQTHATIGAALLSGSASPLIQTAEAIARTHHERWDGTGYPSALRGEEIPLAGRIAAICDVYDALLTERPYKNAWTREEALEYIEAERGRHFDPVLAGAFVAMIRADAPSFEATLAPAAATAAAQPARR
jgi:CHASE2 domain-containing sensor protein